MIKFTAAIPTYNGGKRLPELLSRLASQRGVSERSWEIIVVNNNSDDETDDVLRGIQGRWTEGPELRHCLEPRQGTAYARIRAAQEARAPLIGFLDDDILPSIDWVAAAIAFGSDHPRAGAYGSRVRARFEVPPPPGFEKIAPYFGLLNLGDEPRQFLSRDKVVPAGCATVVRALAWTESTRAAPLLTGPERDVRSAGEDIEPLIRMQQSGWEVWYNPRMEAEHLLPSRRLDRRSLLATCRAAGLARHALRRARWAWWQVIPGTLLAAGADFLRLVSWTMKNHRYLRDSVIAQCELETLKSSLLSPLPRRRYKRRSAHVLSSPS